MNAPSTNYAKYQTGNPIMQRVIRRFLDRVVGHVRDARPERVIDLGAGEGMVARELSRLPFAIQYRGSRSIPAPSTSRAARCQASTSSRAICSRPSPIAAGPI
ncbi:MAG: class I SAM-dependent methyltransferase [Sandaracinaceae bacterium]|nr:class I SAM-dependent methyltransferase [Sandaracinaceae bacterium]